MFPNPPNLFHHSEIFGNPLKNYYGLTFAVEMVKSFWAFEHDSFNSVQQQTLFLFLEVPKRTSIQINIIAQGLAAEIVPAPKCSHLCPD
jgi:hypothetical protein